jgi:hypothetical protein
MSQWAIYQDDKLLEVFDEEKLARQLCEELKDVSAKIDKFGVMQTFPYSVRKIAQSGSVGDLIAILFDDLSRLKNEFSDDEEDDEE